MAVNFVGGTIFLSNQDVTLDVRSEEVSKRASEVAKIPEVRKRLLERQRAFRRPPGLVADGRDMGSVVFPDAILKIFLTAGSAGRGRKRDKPLLEKGMKANNRPPLQEVRGRDAVDRDRRAAPHQQK